MLPVIWSKTYLRFFRGLSEFQRLTVVLHGYRKIGKGERKRERERGDDIFL